MKDKTVKHTMYFTMNKAGVDKFFEGVDPQGRKPLQQAKVWAKKNGYTHLKVISSSFGKSDVIYMLNK